MEDRKLDPIWNWVEQSLGGGAQVLSATPLQGGISATLHTVKFRRDGDIDTVVLRQFTNQEWLRQEPDLAQHEAESLTWANQVDVPTPKCIAYKETDVPAVLMTKLPGAVELQPAQMQEWLHQLAATLVRIHALPAESCKRHYFAYNKKETLQIPEWSAQKDVWLKALDIVRGSEPKTRLCFIHRDYHPTNVLWEKGQVSGVVDWVNACRGPAGVDVGHCRLNLAQLKGVQAADLFLEEYRRLAGADFTYEPYWDLVSLMEAGSNPPDVYQGWLDLGVTDLTADIVKERYETLVASVVQRASEDVVR